MLKAEDGANIVGDDRDVVDCVGTLNAPLPPDADVPDPIEIVLWVGLWFVVLGAVLVPAAGPVVVRSTGSVNGVRAQATAVIPGTSTRSPYAQYGVAELVLH